MSGPFPIVANAPSLGGVYPTGVQQSAGGIRAPGGGGGESPLEVMPMPAPSAALQSPIAAPTSTANLNDPQVAADEAQAREVQAARLEAATAEAEAQAARDAANAEQRAQNTPPVLVGESAQQLSGGSLAPPKVTSSKAQRTTGGTVTRGAWGKRAHL